MRCDDEVQREGRVSKFKMSKVEGCILSNMNTELTASWTIFITKTVLRFSSGRVWSVSFPLMGTDTPHQREGRPCGAPCAHVSKNQKGYLPVGCVEAHCPPLKSLEKKKEEEV
jgi:hypothetical protein